MSKLKQSLKIMWSYRWAILIAVAVINLVCDTVQSALNGNYRLAFLQGVIVVVWVFSILQQVDSNQKDELIRIQDDTIKKQSELIDKQFNYIKRLKEMINEL